MNDAETDADAGTDADAETDANSGTDGDSGTVRVWLVERTFSDDEQNIVILLYATPDGSRVLRKERALTSFTGDARETLAAVEAEPHNLDEVAEPERRERYAEEATRVRESHAPDDPV